jgi:hypothetical protein
LISPMATGHPDLLAERMEASSIVWRAPALPRVLPMKGLFECSIEAYTIRVASAARRPFDHQAPARPGWHRAADRL